MFYAFLKTGNNKRRAFWNGGPLATVNYHRSLDFTYILSAI